MNEKTEAMTVQSIEDQGDRLLLYGQRDDYYVIASPGTPVHVGDEIRYEPYGCNFGWYDANQGEDTR